MKKLTDKQRYINLMEKVNKVKINESVFDTDTTKNFLQTSFEKLKTNEINVDKVNTNVSDDESFVELRCSDNVGNKMIFNFKAISSEGVQDGVFRLDDAELIGFSYESSDGTRTFDIDEVGLREFNQQFGAELIDIISDYVDVEQEQPLGDERMFEAAIKKIESIVTEGISVREYDKLSYEAKKKIIQEAKNQLDVYLYKEGVVLPEDTYIETVKRIANGIVGLNERRTAWVTGSKAVEVKPECRLGGKGDGTSKACNQGDINNLTFRSLDEKDDGYPESIARDFAGAGGYPKPKKKHRVTKKKIKEESGEGTFGVPGYSQIRLPQDNIEEGVVPQGTKATITVNGHPYYLESIGDSTHFFMSNSPDSRGMAWHVGQHNDKPYYYDLINWLRGGEDIDGKEYTEDINEVKMEKSVWDYKRELYDLVDDKDLFDDDDFEDFVYRCYIDKNIRIEDCARWANEGSWRGRFERQKKLADKMLGEFDDTADILLGFKPRNVGENFDYAGAEVSYDTKAGYDRYLELIQKPFKHLNQSEKRELIDLHSDFSDAELSKTKLMPEADEYEVNAGDRFEDGSGHQYTVSNVGSDSVNVRRNDGEQQEVTPDALKFAKKLNEQTKNDFVLDRSVVVDLILAISENNSEFQRDLFGKLGAVDTFATMDDVRTRINELSDSELEILLIDFADKYTSISK